MTTPSERPTETWPKDADNWAKPVDRLKVSDLPSEAVNINVDGRQVVGPLQGFGKLWQKTYWVRLSGVAATPAEVIEAWKANFAGFWPEGNRFYAPFTGIAPGDVAVLNLAAPGGVTLSTGVMVIYADDESFTFMTPEGHMFSGWITFSAHDEEGVTVIQVQVLIRANDPLWEIVMRAHGFKKEDQFWSDTLRSLASHFGIEGQPQMSVACVDPRLQWSQAKNIWHNAAIRSAIYGFLLPLRWTGKLLSRR